LTKFKAYWRLNRSGLHCERYGCRYFVVLTVTVSPERRDNLAALAQGADDWQKGSPLFRFACVQDFSRAPAAAGRILGPIWRTPASAVPTDLFS
jgi:hypothetical protein